MFQLVASGLCPVPCIKVLFPPPPPPAPPADFIIVPFIGVQDYPEYLAMYDGYEFGIQRADAMRLFFLHKLGGIYIDLDIECKRSLDFLRHYSWVMPQVLHLCALYPELSVLVIALKALPVSFVQMAKCFLNLNRIGRFSASNGCLIKGEISKSFPMHPHNLTSVVRAS